MPLGLQWYFLLASGEELETKLSSHHGIQGLHDTFMTATGNPLIFQNKMPDSGSQAYTTSYKTAVQLGHNAAVSDGIKWLVSVKKQKLEFVSLMGFFMHTDLQTAVNLRVDILSWRTTSLMLIGNHA